MASSNDNGGVLRRMVKMVSSPARDLMGLPTDAGASQFADVEKAELKAMIERKRRNDFVRKRELDMLRRIRREGLSPEQASALGASSRLDDSDVRPTHLPGAPDPGMKAKIDAIEKQMVGSSGSARLPRGVTMPPTLTTPIESQTTVPVPGSGSMPMDPTRPMSLLPERLEFRVAPPVAAPNAAAGAAASARPAASAASRLMAAPPMTGVINNPPVLQQPVGLGKAPELAAQPPASAGAMDAGVVEVQEITHDHELDEAVIAFANADFALCERALVQLTAAGGARQNHNDTWLVLFDLFRATGQQASFDALANEYLQRFQRSSPQWFSLPKLVAEAASQVPAAASTGAEVAWVCPAHLDVDAVTQLNSQTLQLPQPWVLDWTQLQKIDPDAAARLYRLMQGWARQVLEMRWLSSDRLFMTLQDAAPVGVRDADPAYWMTRLEALRMINRPDQFDEVAIDYCVTYEVSPPSWEPTRCSALVGSSSANTQSAPMSVLSEPITTIQGASEGKSGYSVTSLELSGQLSGDIGPLLGMLDNRLGTARMVHISCALLIRVDFIAAGDLLNWVIAKRAEGRNVRFTEVHRLVALMFGAMGIVEHAYAQLRQA
ncbi:STAS domain-containing protein [Ideonella azotifigens]|uniref:STAS domain-containing protein n=2 Tax=Ideonella azotifigens TaxID=513160 RepID=A0ABN1KED8_9BURK|nr:STAS domain-containing protein [Ideonella azotifigens]MCD2344533.1 STAS domain-containing protein [Ideonella azotifigens]